MSRDDNERFLRTALTLQMINLEQFNEAFGLWRKDPSEDSGRILLEKGFISEDQYHVILAAIIDSESDKARSATESYTRPRVGKEAEKSIEGIPYSENFELRSIIGQGGAGRVFLAFDKSIGRDVAIKELLPAKLEKQREHHLARFIREAKISGQLEHPGIVPVYELTEKPDGTFFYVMKYVQGKTLFHSIIDCATDTPLESFKNRLRLLDNLIDVAEAMGYAHSKGIIHRDLKPSNIILGEFGETVILDWGLAKRLEEDDYVPASIPSSSPTPEVDVSLTMEGAHLGTPSYMSPEQIDPKYGRVDYSTDVYTLGILLYTMLTGTKPFPGKGAEVMKDIMETSEPPSPRALYDFIPPELSAICQKAMAKHKEGRFKDASEFASELKAYRDGRLVSIYAYSTRELFKRFISRNKIAILAAVAVIISIMVGAGFALNFAMEAQRARYSAERALIDVTSLSESTMELARRTVGKMSAYFHEVTEHMESTAREMETVNLSHRDSVLPHLETLYRQNPEATMFMFIDDDRRLVAAFAGTGSESMKLKTADFKNFFSAIAASEETLSDVIYTYRGHHAIVVRVPIFQSSKAKGSLIAVLSINDIIESAITFDPTSSGYQVWCMKQDGYIFYDENPAQIGKNLFTDKLYKNYPALIEFGERISKEPWGVGHYRFTAKGGKSTVFKVAAWDSFTPAADAQWKVVIAHQYVAGVAPK
ncbi:MAG: serine/threonine protein kinase [Pseudomonadota bacterium]